MKAMTKHRRTDGETDRQTRLAADMTTVESTFEKPSLLIHHVKMLTQNDTSRYKFNLVRRIPLAMSKPKMNLYREFP